jgi:hypothetical protein
MKTAASVSAEAAVLIAVIAVRYNTAMNLPEVSG